MQSSNPDNFFQTDASNAQRERKAAKAGNKHGSPLMMKSKILAGTLDPASPTDQIFIAEAAGYVRRINLSTSEPKATYRGPKAPVTCVAVGGQGRKTIFAGCWDKDIWSWDIETSAPGRKFSGHTDFVKTVICATISDTPVLISGGADKKIMVWEIATGHRLHTLQDPTTPMMALQHLAVDPVLSTPEALVFASAGSDPHIRRWRVTLSGYEQLTESFKDRPDTERLTIEEHETSVYRLVYDWEGDDVDLWTASADGTVKVLARSREFVEEDRFEHGDYVRAVAVTTDWVVTAGRNEDVKVWDRTSGKLRYTLEGHFEEVTDLITMRDGRDGATTRICSLSIDRTIRTWPLTTKELDKVVEDIEEAKKPQDKAEERPSGSLLTAEEEAELAELMDD